MTLTGAGRSLARERPAPGAADRQVVSGFAVRQVHEWCYDHLDALWFLACLSLGKRAAAERAVRNAVAAAATDPTLAGAREARVWATLARHVEHRSAVERARTSGGGPSAAQRQMIALVQAGHHICQVAALLDVPLATVYRDLRAGLAALRMTIVSLPIAGRSGGEAQTVTTLGRPSSDVRDQETPTGAIR